MFIVNAYLLNAEPVGVWHVEGMPTEQIIASAIFYYESSSLLEDDGLMFRRERDIFNDFPSANQCMRVCKCVYAR